jgi:photosystem II stability/assembly factor-like uncharacterized protein
VGDDRIFLAGSSRGVARAQLRDGGEWRVDAQLAGLDVTCLANDPSKAGVVYAGTRADGVWRSQDSGASWEQLGLRDQIVKSLAVSPHDSRLIYAGIKPARMFRSADGGRTWAELTGFRKIPNRWWWFSPAEPPDLRAYVIAIAVSPTDPGVLLAGIEFGGVVLSEDGGETWSRHRNGALRDCHSLKFHATNGEWVYEAGGTGGGASFSRDAGRTWEKAGEGLAKSYGIVCAADPGKPEVWYVCVAPSPGNAFGEDAAIYLYRSSGGAGWTPIGWGPHPLPSAPTALVTIPGRSGHLYAGLTNGQIWHTPDFGDTWQELPFSLGPIWSSMQILDH